MCEDHSASECREETRRTLTFAEAVAVIPRLAAMSLLDVVATVTGGVGSSEGMTGSGRSPGRLLPLTTAEAQL